MITKDLYKKVLLEPASSGHDELFIVSGYASATFLNRHIIDILKSKSSAKINLIIGMNQKRRDHQAYLDLSKKYSDIFSGFYYQGAPEVHSKAYAWAANNRPLIGYSGSANYSQYGFFSDKQQNQMAMDNPEEIVKYYHSLVNQSTPINEFYIDYEEKVVHEVFDGVLADGDIRWVEENKAVRISLLRKNGELPQKSGLNWGQRPEANREPNQAYLAIRKSATKEGFLPEKGLTFTIITDDNVAMDCAVQQDGRKGVSTTYDNSEIGRYFRNRLSVPSGGMVLKEHLTKYGRSDFLLTKLEDEIFYLDFSV